MAAAVLAAVKPLALESLPSGGQVTETNPTEIDPRSDAIVAAGVYVTGPGVSPTDKTVLVDRAGGGMRFADQANTKALSELVTSAAAQPASHASLADLIHFLSDGPGDGWASGAYCQESYSGVLLTKAIWYTSASLATPIVSTTYTYNGLLVTTKAVTLFSPAGVPLRTITDTYSYNGVLRTGRTRTYA